VIKPEPLNKKLVATYYKADSKEKKGSVDRIKVLDVMVSVVQINSKYSVVIITNENGNAVGFEEVLSNLYLKIGGVVYSRS